MIIAKRSFGDTSNRRKSSTEHLHGIIVILLAILTSNHLADSTQNLKASKRITIPDITNHRGTSPRNATAMSKRHSKAVGPGLVNRLGSVTSDLLNDIEDDFEDDQDEEFYKRNPIDHEGSPSDEDNDYMELADIELQMEPEKPIKAPGRLHKKGKAGRGSYKQRNKQRSQVSNGKSDKAVAAAAEMQLVDEEDCAFVLHRESKGCISYADIDEAIESAKDQLGSDLSGSDEGEELSEASINSIGELSEQTTRILADKFELTWDEISSELEQVDMSKTIMWKHCPKSLKRPPVCTKLSRYRTHSGHCNNLVKGTHLGATNTPFKRNLAPDYGDKVGEPRTGVSSGELPPVRLISLNLHPDFDVPSQDHSALFMAWGQLLNHDLAMASNARDSTGHSGSCCGREPTGDGRTCLPIELALDDPLYSRHGIRCHEFKRSLAAIKHGCSLGPRGQINTITSYVDASFVYGSTKSGATMLRASTGGQLQVWNYFKRQGLKPLLPPQIEEPDEECVGRKNGRYCFLSGDLRTNQQIQLVVLHTIHKRQHNRLAGALSRLNPHWNSNKIYHEARHIHIALIQHILISEYLPALLGQSLVSEFNLEESPLGSHWDHYQPAKDASISYGFAAAAFRQGHSTIASQVHRFDHEHKLKRTYQLRHLYRQPWPLFEPGAMDEFLLGTLDAPAQTLDPFISPDVSGHLLQMPNERVGLDLVAINIQRGRDQGVPGYNAYREWCNLGRANKFTQLEAHMRSLSAEIMANLYEHVDDIDLFTGGISEFPLPGAQVGPTFACIIGRQFESLRAGDRFWFERSRGLQAFSLAQLDSIKQVSLARLICANSDEISTIQEQALRLVHPVLNPRKTCDELADLDMSLWKEGDPDEQWKRS